MAAKRKRKNVEPPKTEERQGSPETSSSVPLRLPTHWAGQMTFTDSLLVHARRRIEKCWLRTVPPDDGKATYRPWLWRTPIDDAEPDEYGYVYSIKGAVLFEHELARLDPDGTARVPALNGALGCLCRALGCRDIEDFNDDPDTTHDDVLAAYDRAIWLANNPGQPMPDDMRAVVDAMASEGSLVK